METLIWAVICFFSGSVPWAVLIGKFLSKSDVREVGDGNPGATNAWKSGGWIPGLFSVVAEVSKSLVPVHMAVQNFGQPDGFVDQICLAMILLAPILGHAWSPFLNFKGGKALAVTWGSWIAITGGIAFPVALILLGLIHILQKNHAITVTSCLAGFLLVFLPLNIQYYLIMFWICNMAVVMYRHREEYRKGLMFRDWITGSKRRTG
jgi:glycerol-3-phosphate acyltransferase PlsY